MINLYIYVLFGYHSSLLIKFIEGSKWHCVEQQWVVLVLDKIKIHVATKPNLYIIFISFVFSTL